MKKIDLITLVNKSFVDNYVNKEATEHKKNEERMQEYSKIVSLLRKILVDSYGEREYPLAENNMYQSYGFCMVVEKGATPLYNSNIRVFKNEYSGQSVYSISTDRLEKNKILLTLFESLMAGRTFPSSVIDTVINRYVRETDEFEFFSKFDVDPIPTELKTFFTKSKSYKDMKEYRLCKSYYGFVSKGENARKNSGFSYSPAKVELAMLRNSKGEFEPAFLFNLPVLSTLKFKYAVPMFSDNMEASVDELFEKFNTKFLKCVVDIIGRAEKLRLKEKKLLLTLPREELIGRLKVAEMLTY